MAVAVAGVAVGLAGGEVNGFLRTVLGAGEAMLAVAGGLGATIHDAVVAPRTHLRADAAAHAFVGIDDGGAAAQAAGGLDLDLLFGEALDVLIEGLRLVDAGDQSGLLSLGVVIRLNGDVVLVELEEVSVLTGQGQGVAGRADEAVQGFCRRAR